MKVAALFAVSGKFPELQLRLIHTGQHYDPIMSDIFLRELGIPDPVCHLGVGSGSHADQTAEIMKGYEQWTNSNAPDITLVVGDVNSTVACALVASKKGIKVAHVEAGLRSFDRSMPEEINRVLTDSMSDLLFVTEPSGIANLTREGRPSESIYLVGNVMIDTLLRMRGKAQALCAYEKFNVLAGEYAFLTLHRPSNVDDQKVLSEILEQIVWLSQRMPVIFPVHPRTRKQLKLVSEHSQGLSSSKNMIFTDPVGYLDSLSLLQGAKVVVTDSGGLQEETTALGIPCLTLRENTERPITITEGTNTLIGRDWRLFRVCIDKIGNGVYLNGGCSIPYWDGNAGERILATIQALEKK